MSFDPFGQDPNSHSIQPDRTPERIDLDVSLREGRVREKILLPGMLLLVSGILNLLAGLGLLGIGAMVTQVPKERIVEEMEKQNPKQLEEMRKSGVEPEKVMRFYAYGGIGGGILVSVVSLFTMVGGICILTMRAYPVAMLSSIVTAVPCISPMSCPCVFGMIIGIWSVTVLLNQDVRQGFR